MNLTRLPAFSGVFTPAPRKAVMQNQDAVAACCCWQETRFLAGATSRNGVFRSQVHRLPREMTTVDKLLQQLADLDKQLDALLTNEELTDEQRAAHDQLLADRKKVTAKIAAQEQVEERARERQVLETRLAGQRVADERTSRTSNRLTDPDKPTANAPKVPAVATGPRRKLPNGTEVEEAWIANPTKGFHSHTDFLRTVMEAGRSGRVDQRLRPLAQYRRDDGDESVVRGADYLMPLAFTPQGPMSRFATAGSDEQGTYSDPYGGFLVGKTFRPELLRLDPEGDPMGQYTTKIPMETPSVEIPARVDKNHTSSVSGGLRVYRRSETQTSSTSRMELETIELKATAIFGSAYATEELLSRSLISFLALLQAGFSDEFTSKLIRERLEGTGAGQFEGVLNCDCIVSVSAESGQAADTIKKENIDKMMSRCWRYGRAIWLANHNTIPQLLSLVQTIGTSGETINYFSMTPGGQAMLLGRPLYFSEYLPKLGDTGDLLLGNWSEYLEGQLSPLQNAESMHVRFLEHERTFKFWMENAGRVWWRSALTPAKATETLSPFIKLAAR